MVWWDDSPAGESSAESKEQKRSENKNSTPSADKKTQTPSKTVESEDKKDTTAKPESLKARTAKLKANLGNHTPEPEKPPKTESPQTDEKPTSQDKAHKDPPKKDVSTKDDPPAKAVSSTKTTKPQQTTGTQTKKTVKKPSDSTGETKLNQSAKTVKSSTAASSAKTPAKKTVTRTRTVTKKVRKKVTKPRVVVRDEWGVADLSPESMPFSIWGSQGVQDFDALAAHQRVLEQAAADQLASEREVAERLAASRAVRQVPVAVEEPVVEEPVVVIPAFVEPVAQTPVAAPPVEGHTAELVNQVVAEPVVEPQVVEQQPVQPPVVQPAPDPASQTTIVLVPPTDFEKIPVVEHPFAPPALAAAQQVAPHTSVSPVVAPTQVPVVPPPAAQVPPTVQMPGAPPEQAPGFIAPEHLNQAPPAEPPVPEEPKHLRKLGRGKAKKDKAKENLTAQPGVTPPSPKKPSLKKKIALTSTGEVLDPKRSKMMTLLATGVGIVMAIVGVGTSGFFYFESHAKPGTQLAGHNVSGFNEDQLRDIATNIANNYQPVISHEGNEVPASPKELGITFDIDATVARALGKSDTQTVASRYNPLETKQVLLEMDVNRKTLEEFLDGTYIDEELRSTPASLKFSSGQFVLINGVEGTHIDGDKAEQTIRAAGGMVEQIAVVTAVEPPKILDEEAQKAVDEGNLRLTNAPVITGNGKNYTLPAGSIAGWLTFTPDFDEGIISMTIDEEKLTEELPVLLADYFTKKTINGETLVRPDGGVLAVYKYGQDGTQVKDPEAATATVLAALTDGTYENVPIEIIVHKATNKQVQMDKKYLVPNGEKWAEVNRSNFTVTLWEGTTQIQKFSVVIGLPGTPTHTGVYKVWSKVRSQTMSGPGYSVPNVQWIAYFNNGIAFHGNYWAPRFGRASSHGCVGLPNHQAKVVYEWINVGTMVVVHD
ncbi:MAG: L,D-transpeptidase/peptidoglycan binding protein [Propionibacteriaceae bacterium]|nr:L,D-transpeptidase/peptidoglycan binding protein [Propionibacteriaceae bacterium]